MQQPGVAWNAGIFMWRRRAILAALRRYTGLVQSLGPMVSSPQMLDRAYESIQRAVSIDYAVMESAARNGSGGDGLDGRRLVGPRVMVVAAGGASVRAAADRSSRPARP